MVSLARGMFILGVALIASSGLSASPALAASDVEPEATNRVVVTVQGVGCPFCVFGIEKWLGKIDGVQDVQMDLETGRVTLTLEPGASVTEDQLRRAVEQAGFTPGETIQGIDYRGTPEKADAE